MPTEIDLAVLIACAACWLGPLVSNAARGRVRLLHPNAFFPIMIVYMLLPPLGYRLAGEPMLLTSEIWWDDPSLLTTPMIWMALFGVCYHAGVRLAGLPLRMTADDDVDRIVALPAQRRVPTGYLVAAAAAVLASNIVSARLMPRENFGKGYYWMHLFFMGFRVLPILVLAQDRRWGAVFLLASAPAALLMRSKAAFLYIAIGLVLHYQRSIFRISRVATAGVVVLVLLTPLAVARYKADPGGEGGLPTGHREQWESWDQSLLTMAHREYAFEAFAIVHRWRREGRPLKWGSETFHEAMQMVPSALWPDKPFKFYDFPREYLPRDFRGYETHYARHVATVFFIDFDVPGACLGFLGTGWLFGRIYRKARDASLRRRESWPMIANLCWVIQAKSLVDGGFAGSIPNALGLLLSIYLTLVLAEALFAVARRRLPTGLLEGPRPWNWSSPASSRP